MRLLVFLGLKNPAAGAAWTRINFITTYLSNKGFVVDILGTFSPIALTSEKSEQISRSKIEIYNIVPNIGLSYKNPFSFILNLFSSFFVSLIWILIRLPKVVIASLPPGDTGLGFIIAALLLKRNLIIDHRDTWDEDCCVSSVTTSKMVRTFYSSFVIRLSSSLYKRALVITTVTRGFQESLRSRGIRNVVLIPNGADVTTFKPTNIKKPHKEFRIIYSGLIGYYYSFDEFLLALKQFKDKRAVDLKFLLLGQGNQLQNIMTSVSKLGLDECVEYHGMLKTNELIDLTAGADVGLIPTLYSEYHLPVKFFEYCACGLPVIAAVSKDSELANLIIDNQIGIVCKPHDIKALSDAIEKMYEDRIFRDNAGKQARLLIEQRFDRNKINEKILDLIEALISK